MLYKCIIHHYLYLQRSQFNPQTPEKRLPKSRCHKRPHFNKNVVLRDDFKGIIFLLRKVMLRVPRKESKEDVKNKQMDDEVVKMQHKHPWHWHKMRVGQRPIQVDP